MSLNATPIGPMTMLIFGATGNLSTTRLFPALFHLFSQEYTPKDLKILGVSRRPFDTAGFQKFLTDVVPATLGRTFEQKTWARFVQHISYLPVDFTTSPDFDRLCTWITAHDRPHVRSKLYYLAVAPHFYETIFSHLRMCQLPLRRPRTWTRVIVEKPFGADLSSATRLNAKLKEVFHEDEIYRIDHYLGKETVQNILAFRFANGIFEPTWNRNFIDHVQISVAESAGIGKRGAYYDRAGALRDVGQNHLLQLLAHVAMEKPSGLHAEGLRHARTTVLQALRPASLGVRSWVVYGQYAGYRQEKGVRPDSSTETFVAMKVFVETARFQGVPFYLRTGKGLPQRVSEVSIQFKTPMQKFFGDASLEESNVLTLRIQPDEGISLRLNVKAPGHGQDLKPVEMNFCYRDSFRLGLHEAYETLLLDAMHGDQSLFPHHDEVMASWRFAGPILESWKKEKKRNVYPKGSWGPKAADEFMTRDSREWLALKLRVCDVH